MNGGEMDRLYIVIPAYNEEENIEVVIRDWYPIVEKVGNGSTLLVINDGSRDSTYDKMLALREEFTALCPLTKKNSGHGSTILYGYNYAISQGADYVFQTDSDGQTLPEEFWSFWELRKQYAMVIGHRKGRQDGFSRVLVTKTLKLVCRLSFHVKLTDANTPFRLMQREALADCLAEVPEDHNLSNVLISVVFAKKKLPVCYLPITFRPRQGGVNSINMKKIIKIGKKAWKDFRQINKCLK